MKRVPGKTLIRILAVLIAIILLALLLAYLYISSKLDLIQYDTGHAGSSANAVDTPAPAETPEETQTLDTSGLELVDDYRLPQLEVRQEDDVLNILLLGTDERTAEYVDAARSDAIMLISLDFNRHTGKLVSFERAMGVLILEGDHEGDYDWLTHCFRYGGADLMLREVRELFRVDVDKYVRINLIGLIHLIDAVGGVEAELTQNEANAINLERYAQLKKGAVQEYKPVSAGTNRIDGDTALIYARLRSIDSDWRRIERQRSLVQAFVSELRSADLGTLNELLDTLLPMVRTNFTRAELLKLLAKAPGMLDIEFDQMTIPVDGTYGYIPIMNGNVGYAPDLEVNAKLLEEFLYGGA